MSLKFACAPVALVVLVSALMLSAATPELARQIQSAQFIASANAIDDVVWYTVDHAIDRHGENVVNLIRQCIDKIGPVKTMFNPQSARTASICQLPIGANCQWGVQVVAEDGDHEVTCFSKEKMTRLEQVVHYLTNVGYH